MNFQTDSRLPPPKKEQYYFDEWTIKTMKSHIMGSKCSNPDICAKSLPESKCHLCRYECELKLPSLPDMVFADNSVVLEHKNGGKIEFNTLDALKSIGRCPQHIEVAHAKVWQDARSECEYSKRIVKDYDWTYSTSYSGTLTGLESVPTVERINLEALKVHEDIKFYQEVYLYEDELDDNGCTRCTVKVRVMPSGFFAVFRHYLRVDHVIIRVNDTRLFHAQGSDYILRESCTREAPMSQIKVDPVTYKNPDLVWQLLPLINEKVDKLVLCPVTTQLDSNTNI